MKKLLLLVPVIALVLYFNRDQRPRQEQQEEEIEISAVEKIDSPSKSLIFGTRTQAPSVTVSKSCNKFLEILNEIDFNAVDAALLGKIELGDCTVPEFTNDTGNPESNLFIIRSVLRARSIKLKEDMSKEELADLIVAQFANTDADFKLVSKLTSKLLDLEPSLESIQRLWATSEFLNNIEGGLKNPNLEEEFARRLDPDVLDGIELRPVRLLMKSGLEPVAVEAELMKEFQNNPKDPWVRENLGWSLWKQGRREEAIQHLRQAISYNPDDVWLQNMLAQVTSPNADEDSYKGRINLGMTFNEMFQ